MWSHLLLALYSSLSGVIRQTVKTLSDMRCFYSNSRFEKVSHPKLIDFLNLGSKNVLFNSVVALEQRNLKVGDILEMRLMKRERHSLQPQPVSRSNPLSIASNQPKPSYLGKAGEDHVFSKLLLCTPNEVVDLILHWEKQELLAQLDAEKDCPESCFIQQALELLTVRESNTAVQCLSSFATELVIFLYLPMSSKTEINCRIIGFGCDKC